MRAIQLLVLLLSILPLVTACGGSATSAALPTVASLSNPTAEVADSGSTAPTSPATPTFVSREQFTVEWSGALNGSYTHDNAAGGLLRNAYSGSNLSLLQFGSGIDTEGTITFEIFDEPVVRTYTVIDSSRSPREGEASASFSGGNSTRYEVSGTLTFTEAGSSNSGSFDLTVVPEDTPDADPIIVTGTFTALY